MKIRMSGVVEESIVDGPGIRYTVFVQGCPHHCEGCHNPQTHDFNGGYEDDTDNIYSKIVENPLIDGVTFSGGEPFCQAKPLAELIFAEKGESGEKRRARFYRSDCVCPSRALSTLSTRSQSAGFAGGLFQFVKKLFYLRLNVSHSVSFLQHAPAPCTVIESA